MSNERRPLWMSLKNQLHSEVACRTRRAILLVNNGDQRKVREDLRELTPLVRSHDLGKSIDMLFEECVRGAQ